MIKDEERSEEPRPNLPLLRKVLSHIDAHPEEWVQQVYAVRGETLRRVTDLRNSASGQALAMPVCGTAFCIAGHAVVMAGHDIDWDSHGRADSAAMTASGDYIEDVAKAELGLTDAEAVRLFAGPNTREDVQRYAERVAARAGEVL